MRIKIALMMAAASLLASCDNGTQTPAETSAPQAAAAAATDGVNDWPSYNRTLTSQRYVPVDQINKTNVAGLKQICVYDLGIDVSFQTGPLVIGSTMYATTDTDILAIDAGTCELKWRTHEEIAGPAGGLKVNRGAAFANGKLYRGTPDGRVFAYDAATGTKLWEATLADPERGETIPAAPIVWEGLVFIGNAGGDRGGVKGRMYALDAETGAIKWETYLVPTNNSLGKQPTPLESNDETAGNEEMQKIARESWGNKADMPISGGATWVSYTLDPATGLLYIPGGNPSPDFQKEHRPGQNLFTNAVVILDAKTGVYNHHYPIVPSDFHDWDLAATPALVTTRGGKHLLAAAPKDGLLYGIDLDAKQQLYATPVTTRENVDTPLSTEGTRFCPGAGGGTEWNGPAYSPDTNLFYSGTVDWCVTVTVVDPSKPASVSLGQSWTGSADKANMFGKRDLNWSGWMNAVDADTGEVKWKFHSNAPMLAGVVPTKGGVVFGGDIGARAYAFDADTGAVLWEAALPGAAGGGVVSYVIDGQQRVAYVAGTRGNVFPVSPASAKIVVFGLQ